MSEIIERVAQAIYDAPTTFDGDQIGTHLGNSMMIEGSASDAAGLKFIVMAVCQDAAVAALEAVMEPSDADLAAVSASLVGMSVTGPAQIDTLRFAYQSLIRKALE